MRSLPLKLFIAVAILAFLFVSASAQTTDGLAQLALEKKVKSQILKLPYYDVFDFISFKIVNGTVTLSGYTNDAMTRSSAAKTVARVGGVTNVVNNIELLPLSRFDDAIRVRAYNALANTGNLGAFLYETNPDMRIIVKNGHVTLAGSVYRQSDAQLAYIVARGVPGVFSVTNNLVAEKDRVK